MSFRGLLNQRIVIETPTITQDDILAPTRTWTPKYSNVKCRMEELSSDERLILGRQGTEATHRFFVLPGMTITNKERIRDGSTVYDIISVVDMRGRRKIHHTEIVANIMT
jgi:SPP1 family predicted phage head-tail adaptor